MALSEEEQRTLEQLEAILAQDDPMLAHTLRGTQGRRFDPKRIALTSGGVLAGIGLLVAGMQWHWSIGVLGFLVMFGAAAWFVTTAGPVAGWVDDPEADSDHLSHERAAGGPAPTRGAAFMDKLEERWRRRQDEGR